MGLTHYVDIMIREGAICHQLHARLLMGVHYGINNSGLALAASWPDWKAQPGEFGLLFRVFGDESGVKSYLDLVDPLLAAGLVRAFPIAPVPDTKGRVVFVRERQMDKLSPSRTARRVRRAAARGESTDAASNVEASRPQKSPHFLRLNSTSTGHEFCLFVSRRSSATESAGGQSYGLGLALPDF